MVPCESLSLCGDRACRIARRRTLCGDRVWERSCCGAVRILELAGKKGRREGRREEGGGRREGGGEEGGGGGEKGGEGRRQEKEEEGGGGRRREEEGGRCCESPSMLRITSGAVAGTLRPCLCSAANRSGRG